MAVGLATAFANQLLGTIGGTTFTVPAATWAQLHTSAGDPGPSGTNNISSVTTREQVTWNAPGTGSMTMSNSPSWGSWAGASPETLAFLSIWTLSSGGVFLFSLALSANVVAQTGFPVSISSETVTLGPLAA